MLYKGDIGLYLSGADVPVQQCNVYIVQPTIKQIVQFGETNFLMASQLLGKTEEFLKEIKQGNSELAQKTDFQILLIMIKEQVEVKQYLDTFFELICPDYIVKYTKHTMDFFLKENEEGSMTGQITPFTFEFFQEKIKELFISQNETSEDYDPANEAAKEIAEKIKKGRRIVQEQRGIHDEAKEKISLFGTYASILSIGLQMDINVFFNYTPFQIFDAFNRYWSKSKFDFYQKLVTTPFMDTSKMDEPEEWTRNLYKMDNT